MLIKTTLVGEENTFKSLGIEAGSEIKLEALIANLKKQFEQEYCDTEDVGEEVLAGLKAVKNGRVDQRNWRKVLNEV